MKECFVYFFGAEYTYDMENDELTAAEAAEILGVTATNVRWYHRQGLLAGRRIFGRLLVFRLKDVEAFEKPKKTGRPKAKAAPLKRKDRPRGKTNRK
jgi:hypothetical protein